MEKLVGMPGIKLPPGIQKKLRGKRKSPKVHIISPKSPVIKREWPFFPKIAAWADEDGHIYIVRGRAKAEVAEHEKAHIRLGHAQEKEPVGKKALFRHAVVHEIEVNLYMYWKFKKPKFLSDSIISLLHQANWRFGKIPPKDALDIINKELHKVRAYIPETWQEGISLMNRGYRELYYGNIEGKPRPKTVISSTLHSVVRRLKPVHRVKKRTKARVTPRLSRMR